MAPPDKLSPCNFLALCDVAMDIKEKLQMASGDTVIIPMMRTLIRPSPFNSLLPAKSIELLDNYCELRWTAANYMKDQGVKAITRIQQSKRWDDLMEVTVERESFQEFYNMLIAVYQRRVVDPALQSTPPILTVSTSLKGKVISYDESVCALIVDSQVYKLPPHKNESELARIIFQRRIVYSEMTGLDSQEMDIESTQNMKMIRDTMNRLNSRIQNSLDTSDCLISWENKTISRNY